MGILKNLSKSVMQIFHNVVNTSKTMMQVSFISLQCCEHIKNRDASFNLFFDDVVNTWRTVKQVLVFYRNVENTSKNVMQVWLAEVWLAHNFCH